MKFVFDTNALRAAGRKPFLPDGLTVSVPLVVLQELLYQLSRTRDAGAARATLRSLRRRGFNLLPGFADTVWMALGAEPRFWHKEEEFWRAVVNHADDVTWPDVCSAWDRLWASGVTSNPSGLFEIMKVNGEEFETDTKAAMLAVRDLGRREVDRLITEEGVDARVARSQVRTRQELLAQASMLAELAALADYPGAQQALNAVQDFGDFEGLAALAPVLQSQYRGRLEFALAVLPRLKARWMNEKRPDKNDPFDLELVCAVDDDPHTILVTEERQWRTLAQEVGFGNRVMTWDAVWRSP